MLHYFHKKNNEFIYEWAVKAPTWLRACTGFLEGPHLVSSTQIGSFSTICNPNSSLADTKRVHMCTYLPKNISKCIIKFIETRFGEHSFCAVSFSTGKHFLPHTYSLWVWIGKVTNNWSYSSLSKTLGSQPSDTNTFHIWLACSSSWTIFSCCVFSW